MRRLQVLFVLLATVSCGKDPVSTGGGVPDTGAGRPGEDGAAGEVLGPGVTRGDQGLPDSGGVDAPGNGGGMKNDGGPGGRRDGGGVVGGVVQCTKDSDCVLVNDCCQCTAIPKGEKPPPCGTPECLVASCGTFFITQPTCVGNRCIAGFDCDTSRVMCKRAPPTCPAGQVPSVIGSGLLCYGPCVEARQCAYVPTCDACAKADSCIKATMGFRCVP